MLHHKQIKTTFLKVAFGSQGPFARASAVLQ